MCLPSLFDYFFPPDTNCSCCRWKCWGSRAPGLAVWRWPREGVCCSKPGRLRASLVSQHWQFLLFLVFSHRQHSCIAYIHGFYVTAKILKQHILIFSHVFNSLLVWIVLNAVFSVFMKLACICVIWKGICLENRTYNRWLLNHQVRWRSWFLFYLEANVAI